MNLQLPVPGQSRMCKRLLPADLEDDSCTPESVQAAKDAAWRERYAAQFDVGLLIDADGRIVRPSQESDEKRPLVRAAH